VVDAPVVATLIAAGEEYLAHVRQNRDETDRQRFLSDWNEQYKIEFPLQQAIQAAIDLAAHLAADEAGPRPNTLAGLFGALAGRDMIDHDLAGRLAMMARFRNLLVHSYADIDQERVWEIVSTSLGDLDDFFAVVGRLVRSGD
jgi:uncharacterized protein YutE (UPF0331/DUF86 family)